MSNNTVNKSVKSAVTETKVAVDWEGTAKDYESKLSNVPGGKAINPLRLSLSEIGVKLAQIDSKAGEVLKRIGSDKAVKTDIVRGLAQSIVATGYSDKELREAVKAGLITKDEMRVLRVRKMIREGLS